MTPRGFKKTWVRKLQAEFSFPKIYGVKIHRLYLGGGVSETPCFIGGGEAFLLTGGAFSLTVELLYLQPIELLIRSSFPP